MLPEVLLDPPLEPPQKMEGVLQWRKKKLEAY
jgi:hypothetical protein